MWNGTKSRQAFADTEGVDYYNARSFVDAVNSHTAAASRQFYLKLETLPKDLAREAELNEQLRRAETPAEIDAIQQELETIERQAFVFFEGRPYLNAAGRHVVLKTGLVENVRIIEEPVTGVLQEVTRDVQVFTGFGVAEAGTTPAGYTPVSTLPPAGAGITLPEDVISTLAPVPPPARDNAQDRLFNRQSDVQSQLGNVLDAADEVITSSTLLQLLSQVNQAQESQTAEGRSLISALVGYGTVDSNLDGARQGAVISRIGALKENGIPQAEKELAKLRAAFPELANNLKGNVARVRSTAPTEDEIADILMLMALNPELKTAFIFTPQEDQPITAAGDVRTATEDMIDAQLAKLPITIPNLDSRLKLKVARRDRAAVKRAVDKLRDKDFQFDHEAAARDSNDRREGGNSFLVFAEDDSASYLNITDYTHAGTVVASNVKDLRTAQFSAVSWLAQNLKGRISVQYKAMLALVPISEEDVDMLQNREWRIDEQGLNIYAGTVAELRAAFQVSMALLQAA